MYQHLLVPLDDSDLAIALVGQAVGLARKLGARLTFFHALADTTSLLGGDAEILRATLPQAHQLVAGGYVHELLAKAEAAARALGVPCNSLSLCADDAATAIIHAAQLQGCDLIVVASHGRHSKLGMAVGSVTLELLMRAGRPVLVAAVGELSAPAQALAVIRDEHRALAAVLHAWLDHLQRLESAQLPPRTAAMWPALAFLRDFSEVHHHPKESDHLFRLLRLRTPSLDAELDELDRQHQRDAELLGALAERLSELERTGAAGVPGLRGQLQAYADFVWEHLGREEGVVLPAAQQHLLESDWQALGKVFASDRERDALDVAAGARLALLGLQGPG